MILANPSLLQTKFDIALPYADFVALGEAEGLRGPWDERYGRLELTDDQRNLVQGWTRSMKVLCLTGRWCGDCALQGSALARIAEANDLIDLRFIQKEDEHADLVVKAQINQGFRVPVIWWLSEDFEPVHSFGDRSLSRYRSMARKMLPPNQSPVLATPPADPVREVLNEMIDEFERVHLILRTSPRLREKHDD